MSILILQAGSQIVRWSWHQASDEAVVLSGQSNRYRLDSADDVLAQVDAVAGETRPQVVAKRTRTKNPAPQQQQAPTMVPEAIGLRVPYGGTHFTRPVLADKKVVRALGELVPAAPIHLPPILKLIEAAQRRWKGVPIVLLFETAFFSHLPACETYYAVGSEVSASLHPRRLGYNGLYHEAACEAYGDGRVGGTRILSICLEPRPELAAVVGGRPVMVTGGSTPLEGLPGERSCGDIDPSIVLAMVQAGTGIEQINLLLTQHSGLSSLAGENLTLDELFTRHEDRLQLAQHVFSYRLLLACGAGIAAMGGVDGLAFSGRYHRLASCLAPPLLVSLRECCDNAVSDWLMLELSREQILARKTAQMLAISR